MFLYKVDNSMSMADGWIVGNPSAPLNIRIKNKNCKGKLLHISYSFLCIITVTYLKLSKKYV